MRWTYRILVIAAFLAFSGTVEAGAGYGGDEIKVTVLCETKDGDVYGLTPGKEELYAVTLDGDPVIDGGRWYSELFGRLVLDVTHSKNVWRWEAIHINDSLKPASKREKTIFVWQRNTLTEINMVGKKVVSKTTSPCHKK